MKAETVKQFMLKKYPTNRYMDCPVPQHHWPVIQEYAEQYARLQIEKDRERVKKAIYSTSVESRVIDETPIILD